MNVTVQIDKKDGTFVYAVMTEQENGDLLLLGAGANEDLTRLLNTVSSLIERTFQ